MLMFFVIARPGNDCRYQNGYFLDLNFNPVMDN